LVHLLRTLTLGIVLLVSSSPLVACSSGGGDQQAATTPTTQGTATTAEQTTTDTGPQPITPSEEAWVADMTKLAAQMNKVFHGTEIYTNAAMARVAKVYSTCLISLRRAGDPGRFGPAARVAQRACKKLNSAGKMMAKAVAIQSAGIQTQAEADKYNDLVSRGIKAQGPAISKLELAKARAQVIREELG
jgi:hypothetical protein